VKVVVDTNIVFSSLLNSSKGVGKILLSSKHYFDFYTCEYLRTELFNNRTKLKKLTKLREGELEELIDLTLRNITTIHEDLIPLSQTRKAVSLAEGIDPSDSPFLALALHLKCRLWTGDNTLINGLRKKECYIPIATSELQELLVKLRG
jgi:predicted nucleic acid-binding protein